MQQNDLSPLTSLVPGKDSKYVPFGQFGDVESIIASEMFYTLYIVGLSGNGKTEMVTQACARTGRDMVRVNITAETDEDDLIGGFRLMNGQTVWHNGPIVMAMERGAICLLDEVDLGTIKLMCLQPVLEGKPIFLKKINKIVYPKSGFNIIATANTKGRGNDDGKFVGANIMNEAFLERFAITIEHDYPKASTEEHILNNILRDIECEDREFTKILTKWSEIIRKSYLDNKLPDIISTRRLIHICNAFKIFAKDKQKAIKMCLNRFDVDTARSFFDLYTKLDRELTEKIRADALKAQRASQTQSAPIIDNKKGSPIPW